MVVEKESDEENKDRVERLISPFYILWTSGPGDYELAHLCIEEGENMREFATVSFDQARRFKEALMDQQNNFVKAFGLINVASSNMKSAAWRKDAEEWLDVNRKRLLKDD